MRHLIYLLALMFAGNIGSAQPASTKKTVIQNVNVISMDPAQPQIMAGMDVYISNGKIARVVKSTRLHKGYDAIDGTGKYLIPGMADMHVHLPNKHSVIQNRDLYLLELMSGFTTIRQMRGKPSDLPLRDSIRNGQMLGGHTYISTPPIFWDRDFTEKLCRDSLTAFKARGYDFVKYLGGLSKKQYDTLIAVAASVGLRVAGHAPANDLVRAVGAHQFTVEHIDPFIALYKKDSVLFWKTIDKMVAEHIATCPNMYWYIITGEQTPMKEKREVYEKKAYGVDFLSKDSLDAMIKDYTKEYMDQYVKDPINFAENILSDTAYILTYERLLPRMQQRGLKLLISATSGDFIIPGYDNIKEMKLFTNFGVSPYETMKCATINAAECMLEADKWGTITQGKRADMVLLSANPLDEIENLRKVDATIIDGNVLTHEYLLNELKKR